MLEIGIIAGFCLVLLAAWFLLRIDFAEAFLIVLAFSAAAGIHWFLSGNSAIAESVGLFALLVITLGSLRIGIEKLSDMLAALRARSCRTRASAPRAKAELDEHHHPTLP
jgi:hypothetical protein